MQVYDFALLYRPSWCVSATCGGCWFSVGRVVQGGGVQKRPPQVGKGEGGGVTPEKIRGIKIGEWVFFDVATYKKAHFVGVGLVEYGGNTF